LHSEWQALLEDDAQTQQLADQLNVMRSRLHTFEIHGKDPEDGKMGSTTERQQENRKTTCEMLLARYKRKSFLHRIVTGDEK